MKKVAKNVLICLYFITTILITYCLLSYNKYNVSEFKDKYLNDEKYLELYNQWLKNNCLSDYKPSFDRIDNTKDYSFDNLQIMTWRENNAKGRRECMKAVRQYDLSGNYIKTYSSIIESLPKDAPEGFFDAFMYAINNKEV